MIVQYQIKFEKSTSSEVEAFGKIFKVNDDVAVQAKDGIIILEEIQLEGKPSTGIKSFLNGHPDFIGSILK